MLPAILILAGLFACAVGVLLAVQAYRRAEQEAIQAAIDAMIARRQAEIDKAAAARAAAETAIPLEVANEIAALDRDSVARRLAELGRRAARRRAESGSIEGGPGVE